MEPNINAVNPTELHILRCLTSRSGSIHLQSQYWIQEAETPRSLWVKAGQNYTESPVPARAPQ